MESDRMTRDEGKCRQLVRALLVGAAAAALVGCSTAPNEPQVPADPWEDLVVTWLGPPEIRSVAVAERPLQTEIDATDAVDPDGDGGGELLVPFQEVVVVSIDPVPGAAGYNVHIDGEPLGTNFTGPDVTRIVLDRVSLPDDGELTLTAFAADRSGGDVVQPGDVESDPSESVPLP